MKNNLIHLMICFAVSLYSTEAAIGCAITKEWCDTKVYGVNDTSECINDLIFDAIGIVAGTALRLVLTDGRWNWI